MKKTSLPIAIFLSLIVLCSTTFSVLALGISGVCYADDLKICGIIMAAPDLTREIALPDSKLEIARSGCCSWHGGVCDCFLGRVVCCDGTLSPSCLCNSDSIKEVMN